MIVLNLPGLRLSSGDNTRGHWRGRARRTKATREQVAWVYLAAGRPKVPDGASGVRIEVVRIAPRRLDSHDGLPSACKAVVDEVVELLGFDDDSDRQGINIVYEQESAGVREYAVRVSVTWKEANR